METAEEMQDPGQQIQTYNKTASFKFNWDELLGLTQGPHQ
jgi:hypothetical protein